MSDTLTLYLANGRPSFDRLDGADVATVAIPAGSELLPVRGEPLLFVPGGDRTRWAWDALDVWLAARMEDRGFRLLSLLTPGVLRRRADDARRVRLYAVQIRRLRGKGLSRSAVAARVGLSVERVGEIERTVAI